MTGSCHLLEQREAIPGVRVFVDSPMASKISEIYPKVRDFLSPEVQQIYTQGQDPFRPRCLEYTLSVEESKALNLMKGLLIIIAGNGMLSGGRILHHLRLGLPDSKNAVIILSYQPRGGLGELLIHKAEGVRMFGEMVRVRASTHTLGGGFPAMPGATSCWTGWTASSGWPWCMGKPINSRAWARPYKSGVRRLFWVSGARLLRCERRPALRCKRSIAGGVDTGSS